MINVKFLHVFALTALVRLGLSAPLCRASSTLALNLGPCRVLSVGKSDVYSYGISVAVQGTEICLAPSTTVNSTFLVDASLCSDSQLDMSSEPGQGGVVMTSQQCRSRRGGFVDRNSLSPADPEGLKGLNPGWSIFNNISAAASATLQLLDDRVTDIVGLITSGQKSTQSHMGLASASTLLGKMKEAGLIGALSWGLNSGSQSTMFPRVGSLIFGGWDRGSLAGPYFDYPVARGPLEGRWCPLQVLITGLSLNIRNTTQEIVSPANKWDACIEPYDNLFRVPKNTLDQFKGLLKGPLVDPATYKSSLLNVEPGIVFSKDTADLNATLRFTINYTQTVEVPFYEVQRPLRGLDPNGVPVVNSEYNELQIYGTPAEGDAPVLGKAFLSQLYLYVNYERMSFHLAAQNPEATTPLPEATDDCSSEPASATLTPETKGLIAVGAVLGALIFALVAWAVYRWRHKKSESRSNAHVIPDVSLDPANQPQQAVQRPPVTHSVRQLHRVAGDSSPANLSTHNLYPQTIPDPSERKDSGEKEPIFKPPPF